METTRTGQLLVPIPSGSTDQFASGWARADKYLADGGAIDAGAPAECCEEKVAGFLGRLQVERVHQPGIVSVSVGEEG